MQMVLTGDMKCIQWGCNYFDNTRSYNATPLLLNYNNYEEQVSTIRSKKESLYLQLEETLGRKTDYGKTV